MENQNKPVQEVKIGAVKATIWPNESPRGTRHSVTPAHLFINGEHWKQSGTFGRDDMLVVAKAADAAFDWIVENQKRESTE